MTYKYLRVTTHVRAQVAQGALLPGQPAPSGAALARATGYSVLTCRKALRALIREGVLVVGTSPGARPRVPAGAPALGEQTQTNPGRALSNSLAARRRMAGLTQPQLAGIMGLSVTSIGHAETGRLWQSRRFWELADKALSADGELLALYDAYRAASVLPDTATNATDPETENAEAPEAETTPDTSPDVAVVASAPVASVTITWADGTATTVYPPPGMTDEANRGAR